MATMIRFPGKTTKIAYKILGIPANIAHKPSAREEEINRKLIAEDVSRSR